MEPEDLTGSLNESSPIPIVSSHGSTISPLEPLRWRWLHTAMQDVAQRHDDIHADS